MVRLAYARRIFDFGTQLAEMADCVFCFCYNLSLRLMLNLNETQVKIQ